MHNSVPTNESDTEHAVNARLLRRAMLVGWECFCSKVQVLNSDVYGVRTLVGQRRERMVRLGIRRKCWS
jgi:hypothetical protein